MGRQATTLAANQRLQIGVTLMSAMNDADVRVPLRVQCLPNSLPARARPRTLQSNDNCEACDRRECDPFKGSSTGFAAALCDLTTRAGRELCVLKRCHCRCDGSLTQLNSAAFAVACPMRTEDGRALPVSSGQSPMPSIWCSYAAWRTNESSCATGQNVIARSSAVRFSRRPRNPSVAEESPQEVA